MGRTERFGSGLGKGGKKPRQTVRPRARKGSSTAARGCARSGVGMAVLGRREHRAEHGSSRDEAPACYRPGRLLTRYVLVCATKQSNPNPTKFSARAPQGDSVSIGLVSLPLRSLGMASLRLTRPNLAPRPAPLASPPLVRLAAGRGLAAGVRCQAQAGDMDGHYMRRCVELARKATGHTSPNPMVGCVIVRDGRVVGEGFHPKAGQPHAEVFALRDAGDLAENSTAYVSLEPCNHYGRTPPCTEALINAKVKKVVIGMTDPNPIVASKGIEKLRGAGINVRVGVEEDLCRKLNEAYIHRMHSGRVFATLRATLSMNGIVTNYIGKGAEEPGGYYSQLAKEYDGIIITSNLARMSTLPISRETGANQPLYIIIAQGEGSLLHVPFLRKENASKAIVFADSPVTVEPTGVEVAVLREMDLGSILQLLAQRGLCSVLVDFREAEEGFVSFLNDFQEEKLIQKVVVEILPVWLASEGLTNLGFGGSQSFPLKNVEHREVNGCMVLEGYV